MAKKWIGKAIKHPGALHEQLGVPKGKKIPAGKMASARAGNYGALAAKRANLAKTLSKFHEGGVVPEDGNYNLKKGERVIPAEPAGEIRRCETPTQMEKRRGYK